MHAHRDDQSRLPPSHIASLACVCVMAACPLLLKTKQEVSLLYRRYTRTYICIHMIIYGHTRVVKPSRSLYKPYVLSMCLIGTSQSLHYRRQLVGLRCGWTSSECHEFLGEVFEICERFKDDCDGSGQRERFKNDAEGKQQRLRIV